MYHKRRIPAIRAGKNGYVLSFALCKAGVKDFGEHGCAHALAVSALLRFPPAQERFVLQGVIAHAEKCRHAVARKLGRTEYSGRFHLHCVAAKRKDCIDAGKLRKNGIDAKVPCRMEPNALFPGNVEFDL